MQRDFRIEPSASQNPVQGTGDPDAFAVRLDEGTLSQELSLRSSWRIIVSTMPTHASAAATIKTS
jgi:hypothetical protein